MDASFTYRKEYQIKHLRDLIKAFQEVAKQERWWGWEEHLVRIALLLKQLAVLLDQNVALCACPIEGEDGKQVKEALGDAPQTPLDRDLTGYAGFPASLLVKDLIKMILGALKHNGYRKDDWDTWLKSNSFFESAEEVLNAVDKKVFLLAELV